MAVDTGVEVVTCDLGVVVVASIVPAAAPASSVGGFEHSQAAAATTWVVNHNLGRKPAVAVRSIGGAVVTADVQHISDNQLNVLFAAAFAGFAVCR